MKDETMQLLEGRLVANLEAMAGYEATSEERKRLMAEASIIAEKIIAEEHEQYEYWDKEDKRQLEREKLEANSKVEQEKLGVTWQRAVLEIAKVVVPTVISIGAYGVFQSRVLEFEENGRITSTAGRELHLPKFMK